MNGRLTIPLLTPAYQPVPNNSMIWGTGHPRAGLFGRSNLSNSLNLRAVNITPVPRRSLFVMLRFFALKLSPADAILAIVSIYQSVATRPEASFL